jgi:DNA modification methylase
MHQLILNDCLLALDELENIDLIVTDLPYGITNNSWDHIISIEPLWKAFKKILKPNGCVVLTAAQPFASMLIMSNLDWFKYDIIWQKTVASGQLNVNHRPLRTHEHILIFAEGQTTYNEQKTTGDPYKIKRNGKYINENYNTQSDSEKDNDGYRHATSVLTFSNPRIKGGHPTQKPISLLENLIKTYSNAGDTVLDCCMGAGSTGKAAINLNRKFIGIEKDQTYFEMACKTILDCLAGCHLGQDISSLYEIR